MQNCIFPIRCFELPGGVFTRCFFFTQREKRDARVKELEVIEMKKKKFFKKSFSFEVHRCLHQH